MKLNLFILDGREPVAVDDLIAWGRWLERSDRRVAKTEVGQGVEVSTVFLGIDHHFGPGGPPLLFETMTFGPEGGDSFRDHLFGDCCDRYSTWDQAEAGHAAICEQVRIILGLGDRRRHPRA